MSGLTFPSLQHTETKTEPPSSSCASNTSNSTSNTNSFSPVYRSYIFKLLEKTTKHFEEYKKVIQDCNSSNKRPSLGERLKKVFKKTSSSKLPTIKDSPEDLARKISSSVDKLLFLAPTVSDQEFESMKQLLEQFSNVKIQKRLKKIEKFRAASQLSPSELAHKRLEDHQLGLQDTYRKSISKEGLPWEQYALGSSSAYQLTEKRALIQLFKGLIKRINNVLTHMALPKEHLVEWQKVKVGLNRLIESESKRLDELNLYDSLLQKSSQGISKGWDKETLDQMQKLIQDQEKRVFGLKETVPEIKAEDINPKLKKLLDRFYKNPDSLFEEEREQVYSVLVEAERLDFVKRMQAERQEAYKDAVNLYSSIVNLIDQTQIALLTILKHCNLTTLQYNTINGAFEHIKLIQKMNSEPVKKIPDWKKLLEKAGFSMTAIAKGTHGIAWKVSRYLIIDHGTSVKTKTELFVVKEFIENHQPSYLDWMNGTIGERTARVNHPNVMPILGAFIDQERVQAVVMPYIEGAEELFKVLEKGPLPENELFSLTEQLLYGVQALHEANLIHKDLKLENILIARQPDRSWKLYIIDPGYQERLTDLKPLSAFLAGSLHYAAPEVIKGKPNGQPADIFSLGLLILALWTRRNISLECPAERILTYLSHQPNLQTLIISMLALEPKNRPTIQQVIAGFNTYFKK